MQSPLEECCSLNCNYTREEAAGIPGISIESLEIKHDGQDYYYNVFIVKL